MLRTAAISIIAFLSLGGAALAQPAPSHPAPSHPAASAPAARAAPAKPGSPPTLAADQFSSEPAAKSHCPGDAVVWANLGSSKAYHAAGDRFYGKTKQGAFMCRKDADRSGFHPAGQRAGQAAAKSAAPKPSK